MKDEIFGDVRFKNVCFAYDESLRGILQFHTDGAEFEHDVSYNVAPTHAGDPDLG